MASFISVPLKKTYEVDLVKPLRNLISSSYSTADNPENYGEALCEFNKLRSNATWKTLDKHESSLEILYRYYDQLNALECKVPPNDIQIPFKWKDAFDKGSLFGGRMALIVSSISFEKVCVLFNVAALQSQLAASQNLDSDDGLKQAAKFFQLSSGIFLQLKSSVMSSIQQDPTPDLHPDTLGALATLMLAQAQESFYVKAANDKMKDVIVAKVAAQCDDLYADALKQLQKDNVRSLCERDWIALIAGKQAAYHALAEFHQSLVAKSQKNVGEELSRLTSALELMKNAETRVSGICTFKDQLGRIQRAHDEAKKDNDFIYHERVPDVKTLTPIGKAALAKPTAVSDHLAENFKDIFESLVPVPVHQAMAAYDIRRAEIVNTEVAKLREQTQTMNSVLASMNLPAALEDVSGDSIPQSLAEKAKAVRSRGGIEAIEKLINELPDLVQRNKEMLDEAERMLTDEQQSDSQLRSQFKERWSRIPSEKLTESMRNNASKYRQIINNAMQADGVVRDKFNTHKNGIMLLGKPEGELQAAIPSANPTKALQSSQIVQGLRNLIEVAEQIKNERDVIESEMKEATFDMKGKFLSALAVDGGINEPVLSIEALGQLYGPLQKQIRESVARQEQLMAQIQSANIEFCKEKNNNQSAARRESTLREIAAAHDAYMELTANLQEGTKFYNDLTQLLLSFQNKVCDFCFARKTEKEELMRDLQQTIANQPGPEAPTIPAHHTANVPYSKPQPPARPPPPVPAVSSPSQMPATAVSAAASVGQPLPPQISQAQPTPSMSMPYPISPQGMPLPQAYSPYPYQGGGYSYGPMPPATYNPYSAPYPPQGYPYQQPPQPYPGYPGNPPNTGYPQQQWR